MKVMLGETDRIPEMNIELVEVYSKIHCILSSPVELVSKSGEDAYKHTDTTSSSSSTMFRYKCVCRNIGKDGA